ncbi:MAG TPA: hypothetical protein VF582_05595 [Allosphingosinicella sp.]|jgi:hypothetical protein
MRNAALLALPLLFAGPPALATVGMICSPAGGRGPQLSLAIGHGPAGGIGSASLRESASAGWRSTSGKNPPLILAQGWIDRELLMVDLADSRGLRRELQLRARFEKPQGHSASGTMAWRGRTWRVRCVQD